MARYAKMWADMPSADQITRYVQIFPDNLTSYGIPMLLPWCSQIILRVFFSEYSHDIPRVFPTAEY